MQNVEGAVSLWALPVELLVDVFHHLDVRSLLNVSMTCTYLYNVASDNEIWSALMRRHLAPEELMSFIDDLSLYCEEQSSTELIGQVKIPMSCSDRLRVFAGMKGEQPRVGLKQTLRTKVTLPIRGQIKQVASVAEIFFLPNLESCYPTDVRCAETPWKNVALLYSIATLRNSYVMDQLRQGVTPSALCVKYLGQEAINVLSQESNLLRLKAPLVVVGTLYGQLESLREVFTIGGPVPNTSYLFLGVEVFSYLLSLKVMYPQRVYLLRGNHDAKPITGVYGFENECMSKYLHAFPYDTFCAVFNYLPCAAVIDNKIFCVHAAWGPSIETLADIEVLDRIQDIPHEGPLCDMVWTDPDDIEGWMIAPKGAGYTFGEDITDQFLTRNELSSIIRSHTFCLEGHAYLHNKKILSIWSCSNVWVMFLTTALSVM